MFIIFSVLWLIFALVKSNVAEIDEKRIRGREAEEEVTRLFAYFKEYLREGTQLEAFQDLFLPNAPIIQIGEFCSNFAGCCQSFADPAQFYQKNGSPWAEWEVEGGDVGRDGMVEVVGKGWVGFGLPRMRSYVFKFVMTWTDVKGVGFQIASMTWSSILCPAMVTFPCTQCITSM